MITKTHEEILWTDEYVHYCDDSFKSIYICQNASNCTLKSVNSLYFNFTAIYMYMKQILYSCHYCTYIIKNPENLLVMANKLLEIMCC